MMGELQIQHPFSLPPPPLPPLPPSSSSRDGSAPPEISSPPPPPPPATPPPSFDPSRSNPPSPLFYMRACVRLWFCRLLLFFIWDCAAVIQFYDLVLLYLILWNGIIDLIFMIMANSSQFVPHYLCFI